MDPTGSAPATGVAAADAGAAPAFVLRLGRALHAYGYPAHRLEHVLERVAATLGLEAQFFSQPTSIFAAFGAQERQRTYLVRVEPGQVQLDKLVAADEIAGAVMRGAIGPATASSRLDALAAAPPRYGPVLTVAAFALSSAAVARFLAGGMREVAVSALIGLVVGMLAARAERAAALRRVFEPLAAFFAAALAALASVAIGPYAVDVATLAGLIVLIPGFTLTTALTELASRHLASGTARLTGAVVTFLAIGVGVAMGGRVAELIAGHVAQADPRALPAWTEALALLLAPIGLTVLFRAPPRETPWIVLAGVLAFFGGRLGARVLGPELGVFAAAFTAGIASNLYARWRDRPSAVTLVPALILVVPGSVGFRGLSLLLERHVVVGVESAFRMVLMLSAMVAGLLLANVVLVVHRPGEAGD